MSKQQFLSSSFKYRQQDPSFVGDQLDQQYGNGPVQTRKCTDVFCCLLMLILIGGMAYVGVLGFKTGQPKLLASPFDQDGNQCGVKSGFQAYDKIFISILELDPTNISFICVKNCPVNSSTPIQCHTNTKITECSALKLYQSKTIVNLCYPSQEVVKDWFDFDHFLSISFLQQCFSDLKTGWPLLGFTVGFAFIVSMLFTVFIRFCAGCFVWLTIILFWLLMIAVGTISFLIERVPQMKQWIHYNDLPDNLKDANYQLVIAIVCWSLAVIQFLIVCCFYKQIRVSIGILKASADFTRQVCYSFLIPIFVTLMQVIYLAAWLTTVLYIFSSSESKIDPINDTPFGFTEFNRNIQMYTILYLFGLLWIMFFLDAIGDYWVSSTVAIWYFQKGQPRSPVYRSICRALKQLGSLAFGSLVVSIVVFIRIMLEYFTKALKQQTLGLEQQAAPAKFALKCASCCIACFERIVRFLTRNAYIMMAVSGKNFCESAKQAFYLMMRSTMQFAISHGTTRIFIAFGKLTIVALCCIGGYFVLTTVEPYKYTIYEPTFLTILFGVVSYPVASAFMGLFEMASNTILMCYCLELDLSKGTNPKCPPGLRNFLRNYMSEISEHSEISHIPNRLD